MGKLYVIVRRDISPEQQAVQSAHAAINFVMEHTDKGASWFCSSNTLALLSVPSEEDVLSFAEKALRSGVSFTVFREPDMGDSATAIALGPGKEAGKLCRRLPLLRFAE